MSEDFKRVKRSCWQLAQDAIQAHMVLVVVCKIPHGKALAVQGQSLIHPCGVRDLSGGEMAEQLFTRSQCISSFLLAAPRHAMPSIDRKVHL